MGFGLVALTYIVALLLTIVLIFFVIYHIIAFDELKTDYKNPVDQCRNLNPLVLPEYCLHAFITASFLLTWQVAALLINLPLLVYNIHRFLTRPVMSGIGLYHPTTILNSNELNRAMKEGWVKLAFYIMTFFGYLFGGLLIALGPGDVLVTRCFLLYTLLKNKNMSLCCSLSNEVPEEPVLSPRSGHIFERRLIEKYLAETGCDPINQQPLSPEELIEVKTSPLVRPKPPYATSIPAILKTLQDEWDAVMLHSFTLRQQLQTARQELSHALYQHDAACRVISRLMKEVTAAREALATLKPHTGIGAAAQPAVQAQDVSEAPATDSANLQEEVGLSEQVITRLQERAAQLTEERKKKGKTMPEGLARSRDISEYKQIASLVGMHSPSVPGILCLDASKTTPERIITGGNDKNAVIFNTQASQVVSILRGHTKKVTRVVYHHSEQLAFTASPDCTVRVWGVEQAQCASIIRAHAGPVTGLSLHAIGDYLLSSSADGQWALSDLRRGQVLVRVTVEKGGSLQGLTCAQFHPDGQILATGTVDGEVKIWDIRERRNAANFTHGMGANQPLTAVSFSENGYYLATGGADGQVKLWDLRKLKNFRTLTPELERANSTYEINDLEFDQSGCYLAVAGSDVRVYLCKQWDELATFTAHTSPATGVRFGPNAKSVISCSLDRSVKIYGTGQGEAGDGDSAMET